MIDLDERVNHYLGFLAKKNNIFYHLVTEQCENFIVNINKINNNHCVDLINYLSLTDRNPSDYLVIGACVDVHEAFQFPIFCKTRPTNKKNKNIILNLNKLRHFANAEMLLHKKDLNWNCKKNKVVWRGTTTGVWNAANKRLKLVEKFANSNNKQIDVGFNDIIQDASLNKHLYECYVKDFLPIHEMLKYKYLISIEGNDVATNIKWIMASNSLLLMPTPKIDSWFCENKLIPWQHYVPLDDDFNNLEMQLEWCEKNQSACKEIVINANNHLKCFFNTDHENYITKKIIESYFTKIKFISAEKKYLDKLNVVIKKLIL